MTRSSGSSRSSKSSAHAHHVPQFPLWADVGLAVVMALGLTAVFWPPATPRDTVATSSGRVLGASTEVDPTAVVNLKLGDQTRRLIVPIDDDSIVQALASAAAQLGTSFTYRSRGEGIYLDRFLDLGDDATGAWDLRINGLPISDLTQVRLEQGDEISLER